VEHGVELIGQLRVEIVAGALGCGTVSTNPRCIMFFTSVTLPMEPRLGLPGA
jgi:hypothetical protein